MPDFVTFADAGNGTGTFSIEPQLGDVGTYTITLEAIGDYGTDEESFTITITEAPLPMISNIDPVDIEELESSNVEVSAINTNDFTTSSLPDFVTFTDAGNGTGTFTIEPQLGDAGTYTITLEANGDFGTDEESFTITVSSIPLNDDEIVITLSFNDTPAEEPVIEVAALRYNKDFAYSMSFDDGSPYEYYNVFPVLEGGRNSGYVDVGEPSVYEEGKFYTDGCGNDIPFRGGLSIIADITDVQDEHNISWPQVEEIYNHGWDIFNHTYTHCSWSSSCDYTYEVTEATEIFEDVLGFTPTHFVVPSNDNDNYIPPALDNGMSGVYTSSYGGYNEYFDRLPIEDIEDLEDYIMERNNMENEDLPYGEIIDEIAEESNDDSHIWFNEFAHRIGHDVVPSGQAPYVHISTDDFRDYMEYIEDTYGRDGSDRVWVASMQTVYEYLLIKEKAIVSVSAIQNNQITITIDISELPENLRNKALSFTIQSDQNFSASAAGASITDNENDLINIDW